MGDAAIHTGRQACCSSIFKQLEMPRARGAMRVLRFHEHVGVLSVSQSTEDDGRMCVYRRPRIISLSCRFTFSQRAFDTGSLLNMDTKTALYVSRFNVCIAAAVATRLGRLLRKREMTRFIGRCGGE